MSEYRTSRPSNRPRAGHGRGHGLTGMHTPPATVDGNGRKLSLEEIERQIEAEGEPISLAEEIAEEAGSGEVAHEKLDGKGDIHIAELQKLTMPQLIEEARKENLPEIAGIKRQDLIFKLLKERVKMNGLMFGEGTLEILPDGFGFLRSPDYHYLSCPDDIYVSPSQIRRFGLRT